jgi:hypothetical protein
MICSLGRKSDWTIVEYSVDIWDVRPWPRCGVAAAIIHVNALCTGSMVLPHTF